MVVLRYYQTDVIARTRARIGAGAKRVIIQGSTGSGKTTVICEIIRCAVAKGTRVLVLVHSRRIVKQISDRLNEFGVLHGILMAGVPQNPAMVQVASRDTLLSRSVRNDWWGFPPAELVVIDECHHFKPTRGNDDESKDDDELSGYESLVRAYPNAVIIGLSATPARSNGRGLGCFFQAMECIVPPSELIREGYLVPVRAFAPERAGHARRRGAKTKGLAGNPVFWWKKLAEGRPTVAFTSRVEQSQALVESFKAAGITAAHIEANTPDEERDRLLDMLQNGFLSVLSNCNVVSEGADVPALSCCLLLRQAKSYVLFSQCVGRIMRPHPSKNGPGILIDHAAAVYEHGLPGDDVVWTLDEGDTVDRRNKEANVTPPEKEPIVCPRCAEIFRGAIKCPSCGHVLARKLRPVETHDELLVEVPREIEAISLEEKNIRLWKQSLAQAANMGRNYRFALFLYHKRTGGWPADSFPHCDIEEEDRSKPVAELLPQFVSRRLKA